MTTPVQTLSFVDVETMPWEQVPTLPDGEIVDVVHRDYENLPQPFLAALERVSENADGMHCEASGCDAAVGLVLYEDDDYPQRSGLEWRSVTLVQYADAPDAVRVVCEDCSPGNVYMPVGAMAQGQQR